MFSMFVSEYQPILAILRQVSADFSDVRDLEAKSDGELQEIMKEKGLPATGTRVQQILAILDAGGLSHHNHSEPARNSVGGGQFGTKLLFEMQERFWFLFCNHVRFNHDSSSV